MLVERRSTYVAVEPDLGGEVRELLVAADVAALDEVRAQQALLHLDLLAVLLGVVQQLVRLHGLGVLERVEVVVEPDLRGDPGHAVEHRLDLRRGHALVLDEEVDLGAGEVHRRVRGELEAVVLDLHLTAELRNPGLELALADVAPRTGDVRPDVNLDCVAHTSESIVPPHGAPDQPPVTVVVTETEVTGGGV